MKTAAWLQRLEAEQAAFAVEALAKPADHGLFDYGRVVGVYQGLEMAKNALLAMVSEDERKGFDL